LINRSVSLLDVLVEMGVEVPEAARANGKFHCPFGFRHSDGGVEPTFRYYPETNTGYCFSEQLYLTPVNLWMQWKKVDRPTAVDLALRHYSLGQDLVLSPPERPVSAASLESLLSLYADNLPPERVSVLRSAIPLCCSDAHVQLWFGRLLAWTECEEVLGV